MADKMYRSKKASKQLADDALSRKIMLLIIEGSTLREVAAKLNVSQSIVQKAYHNTKKKLDDDWKTSFANTVLLAMQEKLKSIVELIEVSDNNKDKIALLDLWRKYIVDMRTLTGIDDPKKSEITVNEEPIHFDGGIWNNLLGEEEEVKEPKTVNDFYEKQTKEQ